MQSAKKDKTTIHAYFPEKEVSSIKAINSACRLLSEKIKKTGAKIIFNDLIPMRMTHVAQVALFKEIISNSIKFNNRSPEIHISSELYGPDVIYKIEDNGSGIPHQMWGCVFQSYKKLYHEKEGEGNGLALARAILDNYNGHIWVAQSSAEGTTICFSLDS